MSSSVHVVVRVRPQNSIEVSRGGKMAVTVQENNVIVVEDDQKFTFDRIFDPSSLQSQVFETVGVPLVATVFEGYNGTIFAYGQTSSGKTHTMQGPDITDPKMRGVIPRVVEAIFETISNAEENMEFTVRGSYVEIYLERIRDLLEPSRKNLQVREDPSKGIYVDGMSEKYVNSTEELMGLMQLGASNRAQAATGMNEGSSRSHSVFILQLVQQDTITKSMRTSKINLVDLAGSEMIRKTGASGARLDEAKTINLSLSALGNVINALTDGKSTHVPYRDSKLTRMLQESLGGNARTWLVINVSPSSYNASETLSTLRFGNRAKSIQNKAVVNQVRSVEELEALLAQAEKAIDVQASFIDKLQKGGSDFKQNVALELRIKELEEMHEADTAELVRSTEELGILSDALQVRQDETETIANLHSENSKLTEALDVAKQQIEHHQYQARESEMKIQALQKEVPDLNMPTCYEDNDDDGEKLRKTELRMTAMAAEWEQQQKQFQMTIQELSSSSSVPHKLEKLIAVHKQLLRKYACAELAVSEKSQLLVLKDERIQMLEESVKQREYMLRSQKEKYMLEIEELQLDKSTKTSFLTSMHSKIVKPLRGGGNSK